MNIWVALNSRSSQLLLAAASPWLRSLLLSIPHPFTEEPIATNGPAPPEEIILVFDGHSSTLVHEALVSVESSLWTTSSQRQHFVHSEVDILEFLLGSSTADADGTVIRCRDIPKNGTDCVTLSSPGLSCQVVASFSLPAAPPPCSSIQKGNEREQCEAADMVVKCEPELIGDDVLLPALNGQVKHRITKSLLASTRKAIEKNLWGDIKAAEKQPPPSPRRSQRKSAVKPTKAPASVSLLLANWKKEQMQKVRQKEELKKKFFCAPCNRGFSR